MAFMKQVLPFDQRFVCSAVHIPQIWWVQCVCSAAGGMLHVSPTGLPAQGRYARSVSAILQGKSSQKSQL